MKLSGKKSKKLLLLLLITFLLSIFSVYSDAYAETWKNYLDEAKKVRNKDSRDTMRIKSLLQKAASMAKDDRDWDGLYQVANMYNRIDSNRDAAKCLNEAAEIAGDKKNVDGLLKIADYLKKLLQTGEAQNCVRSAERIADEKQDRKLMLKVSDAYLRIGDNNRASSCKRKAEGFTSSGSRDWKSYVDEAHRYKRLNRKYDAIKALSKAENLAGNDKKAWITIGDAYIALGENSRGYKCRKMAGSDGKPSLKAKSSHTTEIERLIQIARDNAKGKFMQDAQQNLVEAMRIAEKYRDSRAMENLANEFSRLGFKKYADKCKTLAKSYKRGGSVTTKQGTKSHKTVGKQVYTSSSKSTWKDEYEKGLKFKKSGKNSKASTCYKKAMDQAYREKDWEGLLTIGDAFQSIGNKSKAYSCYSRAKSIASGKKDPKALRKTAVKFKMIGNKSQADQCIRKAEYYEKRK